MKKVLFLTIAILISITAFAQVEKENKGWVGVGLGVGIPNVKYWMDSYHYQPGVSYEFLNFGYLFMANNSLGLSARYTSTEGQMDIKFDPNHFSNTEHDFSSFQYQVFAFYIGPAYSFRLSDNINLDLKALCGVTTISESNSNDKIYFQENRFGYNVGTNLRYSFKNWYAMFSLDYQKAEIVKTDIQVFSSCIGTGFTF